MTLEERIRQARAARGWNREHLAFYSGVSSSTIGRIERGEWQPLASTIIAIARALDLPAEELAAEAGIEIHIPPNKWSR